MEVKVLRKTKTELELEITGEDETILQPLTHELLQHDDIEYAALNAENPISSVRTLLIRVRKGAPEDHLKKAVKALEDEVKAFSKQLGS